MLQALGGAGRTAIHLHRRCSRACGLRPTRLSGKGAVSASYVWRRGHDTRLLTYGLRTLIAALSLDVLVIDTHPGLNEETLLSIVISKVLAIILRPDQQDCEGTGVTVEVARQLKVPHMMLIVNKVPAVFDADAVRAQVEHAYGCPVVAVLPHSDELMTLASGGIFALHYPDHPVTALYKQVAANLAT